jgi:hypothetical protein
MPIDFFKPLDSLRNLPGTGFSYKKPQYGLDSTNEADVVTPKDSGSGMFYPDANSGLELASLQDQRLSELRDNAAKGLAMAAPQNSQRELESDIASSPITKQRGEVNDYLGALNEANQQGFATPKEFAGYQRNIAEEKMRQPMELEKTKGEFGLQEQALRNTGGLDIAKQNVEGIRNRSDLDLLKTMLAVQGRGDVANQNNISRQLNELEKLHSIGVSGRKISDDEYNRRKGEIQAQGGSSNQPSVGGGMRSEDFARKLRADYPNASISDLLTLAQSPDNELGGIDDPGELNKLRQHFMAMGAR